MKKKILSFVFALLLSVSYTVSASAATITATYSANVCHRGFTSSHYLQRNSSDHKWSWIKVVCTRCYYEDDEDYLYYDEEHVLTLKNSNGGEIVEEIDIYRNYGSDYNAIYLTNGQCEETTIIFKVYNSYYHYFGIEATNLKVTCNVTGYLAS